MKLPKLILAFILLASIAHGATPPMYSLTTQPTYLANKGLVPGSGQNAVEISGKFHTLDNVSITGGLHGLFFPGGCSDITIANCTVRNPVPKGGGGYCIYASNGGGLNERVDIIGGVFEIDDKQEFAQFPARLYGVRHWRFFGSKFINRGKAQKASFKLGEGKNVGFYDCKFEGWPPGIGRNPTDNPTYLCEDVKFIRCEIDMNDFKPKNAPSFKIVHTKNGYLEDCKIAMHSNVGVLDIGDGIDGLLFNRCVILGGSGLGKTGAAKFVNSTYLGNPIP